MVIVLSTTRSAAALTNNAQPPTKTKQSRPSVVYPSPATRATTTLALDKSHAEPRQRPCLSINDRQLWAAIQAKTSKRPGQHELESTFATQRSARSLDKQTFNALAWPSCAFSTLAHSPTHAATNTNAPKRKKKST